MMQSGHEVVSQVQLSKVGVEGTRNSFNDAGRLVEVYLIHSIPSHSTWALHLIITSKSSLAFKSRNYLSP